MEERVGEHREEVDRLFGPERVDIKMAEEKIKVEKVDVTGLGTVEVDMGQAEVYRLDQGEWDGAEDEGGGWDEAGEGQRWIPEADGADQAVEAYWEARGRSPSQDTEFGSSDVLGDGEAAADAGMGEAAELEEEEEEDGRKKNWKVELRAKKQRTEELQQVRDLGRVRQAAFDKKK